MKLVKNIAFIILFSAFFIMGCSTKKDTFINRNWHSLNTKDNVLFNGKNALVDGKDALLESFVDNYWEVLPVERIQIKEEIVLESDFVKNPDFERAEEKAAKAIQKHSMNINGREKNPQMDEAFLVLGKSRYFEQRFVPALEAFNYILYKYPNSDKINEAKIWREKTNIRLDNDELALKNLKRLLKFETLETKDLADANAMMGQVYINLQEKDSAIQKIKIASYYTKSNEERGRYYYIIGQLYNELGYKDSANYAFDKVIDLNRKTYRVYMINAEIEKIKNFDTINGDKTLLLEHLTDLEENRENRPFLDKIYHQKALFHLNEDSLKLAEAYFNKSLRKTTTDKVLNSRNYEILAQLKFDAKKYEIAGAYYDSTLTNLTPKSKKFRQLTKKRANLDDVIKYERIVRTNDSILYVTSLPEDEKRAFYQAYIDSLVAEQEKAKEREEIQNQIRGLANNNFKVQQNTFGPQADGGFYFYNQTTLSYGINEFKRIWGNRVLEDNWRLGNKSVVVRRPIAEVSNDTATIASADILTVDYYLNQLPTKKEELDTLQSERNFANYQLGIIYKEKFQEYNLAAGKLEGVLKSSPNKKLIVPSKYNLYKIYELQKSPKANPLKLNIISEHSDSRYAQILADPDLILKNAEDSPEGYYKDLFRKFEDQQYEAVIAESDNYITKYNGIPISTKFEMLKASAIGRLKGFEPYKKALNYIALNYPNKLEGIESQKILDETIPKIANRTFADSTAKSTWKLIFPFQKDDVFKIKDLTESVEKAIKDVPQRKLSMSRDRYDGETTFIVIHNFPDEDQALGFAEFLKFNKDYLIDSENFVTSSYNYKIIQVHKNLDDYFIEFNNPNLKIN